jgi:hypothetical protein
VDRCHHAVHDDVLITADVIMRGLLAKPILGTYELVQFLVILIFFARHMPRSKQPCYRGRCHALVFKKGRALINSIAMLFSFVMAFWSAGKASFKEYLFISQNRLRWHCEYRFMGSSSW